MTHQLAALTPPLHQTIVEVLLIGTGLLIILLLVAKFYHRSDRIVLSIAGIGSTVFMVAFLSALISHIQAESFGPRHRHAGIEFWVCGSELQPRSNPIGLRNTRGNHLLVLSSDKHLYRSGFVMNDMQDATLGQALDTIGGSIQSDTLELPLHQESTSWLMPRYRQDGDAQGSLTSEQLDRFIRGNEKRPNIQLSSGERCPNGSTAKLQTFVYYDNGDGTYYQEKLSRPDDFILPRHNTLPPCIIVEYGPAKVRTDKLCQHFGLRDDRRCSVFGVENFFDNVCDMTEVLPSGEAV